jgi:hypothetical protein
MFSFLIAGCSGDHNVGSTYFKGYLSTDSCSNLSTQKDCLAQTGCDWIAPSCPAGVPCPAGVCYAPDPCLGITDQASCVKNTSCAWSDVSKLCPIGATCPAGGFCHPADPNGCACVTPVACAPNQPCPPPECDCSGGSGGGGTCTCAGPACAPGQPCPPAQCDCGPGGGGGGSGCVSGGTCTCNCPTCPAGQTCPPCACGCGSGGAVAAPGTDPTTGMTTAGGNSSSDPCSKYTDQTSCTGDTADKCMWFALGIPCQVGQPCQSGVCQSPTATGGGGSGSGSGGGCACGCPGCDPSTNSCPPCQCDCGPSGGGSPGCVPPPMGGGGTPPSGGGVACPAIGCDPNCPNGTKLDANGCPTCQCN